MLIIASLAVCWGGACRETPPTSAPPLRLSLANPDELEIAGASDIHFGLALAPDGRRIVFAASPPHDAGRIQLWMRDLSTDSLQPLPDTIGAAFPFWSHDGGAIGFFADGKMRSFVFADRTVHDLAEAPSGRGGAWHSSGDIVFAPRADGPLVRRAADGTVHPLTTLDTAEVSHRLPRFLGDRHLIFFVRAHEASRQGIWIAAVNQPEARKRLVNADAEALTIGNSLIYARADALVAQRVDVEALSFAGRSQLLGTPVGRGTEHQLLATTGGDVLVFGAPASTLRELRWLDRAGEVMGTVGEPMNATDVRVAPDGSRVAVARVDSQLRTLDIWLYEGRRPVPRRLSLAIDSDEAPAWAHDGMRVAWVNARRAVLLRDARAERHEVTLHKFQNPVRVTGWSRDGRWIVVSEQRHGSGADILLLSTESAERIFASDAKKEPPTEIDAAEVKGYAQAPFNETYGTVSPDGRWLAYVSDESGVMEIYVDSFPAPGRRSRLSVGGGTEPRWAPSGDSLFFRRGSEIHLVTLESAGGALEALSSNRLFDTRAEIRSFDVAPNGQHLLVNLPAQAAAPPALRVLIHVQSLLPSAP